MTGFTEWAQDRGLESLSLDSREDRAELAWLLSGWLERYSDDQKLIDTQALETDKLNNLTESGDKSHGPT